MTYTIEDKRIPSTGYYTPEESRKPYPNGYGKYAREGITIHWWNSPDKVKDSDHDKIVEYIRSKLDKPPEKRGSVNYVVSNKKVTLMVDPDNVAWASQGGNPTTISIECSPHLNDEGYKRLGWLINQLDERYKRKLTLYPHSHWFTTECPGTLSLARMRREADAFKSKKGVVMLTTNGLNVLFRFLFGRAPDAAAKRRYVGKMSFDQANKDILGSDEYKTIQDKAKSGVLDVSKHLPADIRKVYKSPATVKAKPLARGLYEVK